MKTILSRFRILEIRYHPESQLEFQISRGHATPEGSTVYE